LTEERNTLDFDFQHRFLWLDDHDILWGLGYRWTRPRYSRKEFVRADMGHPVLNLFSAYLQDDIGLIPEVLRLTLGAKLEHNTYTRIEGQPNFRLLWTPTTGHTIWAAASRAVRIPSFVEDAGSILLLIEPPATSSNPTPFPVAVMPRGNGRFRSETVWAYELGYRFMPRPDFWADLALFYNDYSRLRSNGSPIAGLKDGAVEVRLPFTNGMEGRGYGAELAVDWRPTESWHLQLTYTYLHTAVNGGGGNLAGDAGLLTGSNPQQQFSIRSAFNAGRDIDLDLWLRFVDRLPAAGIPYFTRATYIPAYVTLDARLAWRPVRNLELSVVGQNLLDSHHPESAQEYFAPPISEVPRGVYAKFDWRF
jgi:iron complex outermembrane receptor protein